MILKLIFFPDIKVQLEYCNIYILFRIKAEKTAKKEGDIFDAKKEAYKPSEQRKKDQAAVDTQVFYLL